MLIALDKKVMLIYCSLNNNIKPNNGSFPGMESVRVKCLSELKFEIQRLGTNWFLGPSLKPREEDYGFRAAATEASTCFDFQEILVPTKGLGYPSMPGPGDRCR